jgi:hypothetical protein
VEADDAVVERFQPHEAAAVGDLDARGVHLDEKGADLGAVGGRGFHAGHDDDDSGFDSVGAPELLAVEHVLVAGRLVAGGGLDLRGVGADVGFGEGEGGNLARGAAREEAAFLLFGAEDEEGLGHADGLVGREQRGEVAAVLPEHIAARE